MHDPTIRRGDMVVVTYHNKLPYSWLGVVTAANQQTGIYVVGNGSGRTISPTETHVSVGKLNHLPVRTNLVDVGLSLHRGPLKMHQMAVRVQDAKRFAHLNRHRIADLKQAFSDCTVLFIPRVDGTVLLRFLLPPTLIGDYALIDRIYRYVTMNFADYDALNVWQNGNRRLFVNFILRKHDRPADDRASRFASKLYELSQQLLKDADDVVDLHAPIAVFPTHFPTHYYMLRAHYYMLRAHLAARTLGFASIREGITAIQSRVGDKWTNDNLGIWL